MRVALVVYPGVIADECDAFRSVLSRMERSEVVSVGPTPGPCHGQGGVQDVDVGFDELREPDIVIVPGGLGAERIAESERLREWLRAVEPGADYIVSSSTGSVVLASAGLLGGAPAATHWLAADLLRRYGSEQADRRLVVSGRVVTCQGSLSAVDAAFTLVREIEGPAAVVRIRDELIERGEPHFRTPGRFEAWRQRWWKRSGTPSTGGRSTRPRTSSPTTSQTNSPVEQITPMSVMVELVPAEELRRRRRDRPSRRHS
jgi:transcriptional regulator GlxA family with amidase domain